MMAEADAVGLLRTLLIIGLVYVAIRFAGRYLLPLWIRWFVKRTSKRVERSFREASGRQQNEQVVSDDGSVRITVKDRPKRPPGNNPGPGEYVDYEEVD